MNDSSHLLSHPASEPIATRFVHFELCGTYSYTTSVLYIHNRRLTATPLHTSLTPVSHQSHTSLMSTIRPTDTKTKITTDIARSNEWYLQHLPTTLKSRDIHVLWNDDEHEAYYDIAQRAQADRCQCYRLIATSMTLLQLTKRVSSLVTK